jgi:hypothetical protein
MQSPRITSQYLVLKRLVPRRFSLRSLLVLTGLIALAIGWYTRQLPTGTLSEWQAAQIEVGMSMDEVKKAAGFPARMAFTYYSPSSQTWQYLIAMTDSKQRMLTVTFSVHADKTIRLNRTPSFLEDEPQIVKPLAISSKY